MDDGGHIINFLSRPYFRGKTGVDFHDSAPILYFWEQTKGS